MGVVETLSTGDGMRILRIYLIKQVMLAIGMVILGLIGLQLFILFVNQLPDIGRGEFGFWQACKVVLFQLPYQVYLFFPIASLLGVLLGLGQMANYRELIVMRAAGVSILQISLSVMMVAFIFMLGVSVLGETWVPQCTRWAVDEKVMAMTGGQALRLNQGVWFRQKNDFMFVGSVVSPHELSDVVQFHFDASFHLKIMRHIQKIERINKTWQAIQVQQSMMDKHVIRTEQIAKMPWDVEIDPTVLSLSTIEADEMTLPQLYRYIHARSDNHQSAPQVELVFWQRLTQPFSTMVMMLLAIPFIFGQLRSSPIGVKMLMGAGCGFLFYILNHFLGAASQVFQLSPILAAVFPTILFLGIGMILIRRAM
ncbi:MAG: LPS export ABC transporter permease LptG [Gammaproteobacteria bacterium]|nr:LPS export ABC transporter permease LptG [Gammaproteobacteria bacterium]